MIIPEASLNTGITEESSRCRSRVCFFSESSDLKGLLQDEQFVSMVVILKWFVFQYYAHGFWCAKNGKRRISKGGKIKYLPKGHCNKRSHGTKFAMLEGKLTIIPELLTIFWSRFNLCIKQLYCASRVVFRVFFAFLIFEPNWPLCKGHSLVAIFANSQNALISRILPDFSSHFLHRTTLMC